MALSCEPSDLQAAAKCFECLSLHQMEAVKTYLLAVIAAGSTDPATLLESAKAFLALDPDKARAIQNYLLCQIVNT